MRRLLLLVMIILAATSVAYAKDLGQPCTSSDECGDNMCFYCPADTKLTIGTGDTYAISNCKYMKQQYGDEFQCNSAESKPVTVQGGQGYCAPSSRAARTCQGTWNGDSYNVVMDGDGRTTANLSTQQILSTWKKLVTQDISEQYFSSHFDVVEVNIQPPNTWVGSGDVAAAITYKFKFDWAKTHGPTNPDGRSLPDFVYLGTMTAKTSLEDGTYIDWTFTPYNDAEMKQKFEERRNQQHNMRTGLGAGYTSATEQEIKSIIPEANATALLQTCNKNMSINGIELTSTGKDLQFIAYGTVDSDTENCEGHPDNTHTVTSGMVNLVTGETACRTEKASCAKYSAKAKAAANERTNAPPSATPAQQPGFFKRVANWFKNLF